MKAFLQDFKKRLKSIHWLEFSLLTSLIVVLFLVDLLSKQFVYSKYIDTYRENPYFVINAIPYLFNVTLAFNKGAAWSMGYGMVGLFSIISLVCGLVFLFLYLYYFSSVPKYIKFCLALGIAGDFGNLVDRFGCWMQKGIYKDGVVDFITFAFWKDFPTFNLADSYLVVAIFVALIAFVITFIKGKTRTKKEPALEDDDLMKKLSEKTNSDSHSSDDKE